MTQAGEVRLQFSHRFNFEGNSHDGGQVRLSVNGAPFNLVPSTAFSSNGYGGAFGNEMLQNLTPGFGDISPRYADEENLMSEASLGVFKPGDRLAIQFRGLRDYGELKAGPNWVISSLEVTEGHPGRTETTFAVQAKVIRSENAPAPLACAWQRDCGSGFIDIPGANEVVYRFFPANTDHGCRYRCLLFSPG